MFAIFNFSFTQDQLSPCDPHNCCDASALHTAQANN